MPDLPADARPCPTCDRPILDPGGWNERAAGAIWGKVERCGSCQPTKEVGR